MCVYTHTHTDIERETYPSPKQSLYDQGAEALNNNPIRVEGIRVRPSPLYQNCFTLVPGRNTQPQTLSFGLVEHSLTQTPNPSILAQVTRAEAF